ncbi:MAG: NifU N-terminal domain-containing protein [Caldilineaceae bacterium]
MSRSNTPNPNARKFVLSAKHFDRPLSFADTAAAATHPLAAQLFALGAIYNVLMVQDFITINKLPAAEWAPLEQAAQQIITAYFSASVS